MRIRTNLFFVTYAQCNLPRERIAEFFQSKGSTGGVICQELHEDGNPHLHALIEFPSIKECTTRTFDIDGFHPNVQTARSTQRAIDYIEMEDENVLRYGEITVNVRPPRRNQRAAERDDWLRVIDTSTSAIELRNALLRLDPSAVARSWNSIASFADAQYPAPERVFTSRYTPGDFPNVPASVIEWVANSLNRGRHDRPLALFLIGPTRLGKTEWARCLGRHMYFNGMFDLRSWDDDALYAVWDDIEWEHVHNKKAFVGAQYETTLTDKYARKRTVVWGRPSIFCLNSYPNFGRESDWYQANSKIVMLDNQLY
jgi:hypothetical protein